MSPNEVPPGPYGPVEYVVHPDAVVRVASIAREVLAELRRDGLGDAARSRAGAVYEQSIVELSSLLSEGLRTELCELLDAHRTEDTEGGRGATAPSASELRVAEAQLAGWLDGLLQSVDASLSAEAFRTEHTRHEEQRVEAERRESLRRARDTSYL